ncbi:MAG: DUF2961 domain-containing protein [Candidatus Omnitrophota bacterium]
MLLSKSALRSMGKGKFFAILFFAAISCGPPPPPQSSVSSAPSNTPTPKIAASKQYDTAYFLKRMGDLREFARPHPNEKMILRSSHNSQNGPDDADVFLGAYKLDGDGVEWKALLDEKGPGCITRLWLPSHVKGRLRIYFDNEAKPSIEAPISDFFAGKYKEHFKKMLVFDPEVTPYGYISYFPLPFEKQCAIFTDSQDSNFRYQINVLKLDSSVKTVTFTNELDSSARNALANLDKFMEQFAFSHFAGKPLSEMPSLKIPPKNRKMLINLPGPAALDYFLLHLSPFTDEMLRGLQMKVYWDDILEPAIECSLYDFFCHGGLNLDGWNSLFLGIFKSEGKCFCQFYMPFKQKAQFFLENNTEQEATVSFSYHIDPEKTPDDPLYLFVRTHRRDLIMGYLYPFLEVEGVGNFVGMNIQALSSPTDPPYFYLEGDEYFYVDGENEPAWSGTGLDNYFNSSQHFANVNYFFTPTHGCLSKQFAEKQSSTNCFRFHLLDYIPFQTSLMLVEEVGCPFQYSNVATIDMVNYEWTCYWYGKQAAAKVPRNEELFYFSVNETPEGSPTPDSPIMVNRQVRLRLPRGKWWVHFAPIYNLSDVQHQEVESK